MTTARAVKRVYLPLVALHWFAIALIVPISVLFMQARGLDLAQVGLVMGAYAVTIVLLELPTGGLADSWGRKPVAISSQVILLLAKLLLFLAFSFWGFLLGMILEGVARALNSGALDAWYVDQLQEADVDVALQPALAQAGTVTLLALGLGTLVGGALPALFQGLPADGTALLTPLAVPLLGSIGLSLLNLPLLIFTVHEPPRQRSDTKRWWESFTAVPQAMRQAVDLSRRSSALVALMGATVVGGFTLTAVETFWQPRFATLLNAGSAQSWIFGLIMALSFVAGMAGNMSAIPLSRYLKERYSLVAGISRVIQSAALLLMALAWHALPATAGFWIFYLGLGILNSPHETLVNREIPAARRSAMLSVQSLAFFLGSLAGSAGIGFIAERQSIAQAWFLAALLSTLSVAFYIYIARGENEQSVLKYADQEANAG